MYLDANDYKKNIDEMSAKLVQYRQRLQELINTGKGGSKEADRQRRDIDRLDKTIQKYNTEIGNTISVLHNLSGASYNELYNTRNRLRAQLRQMATDTQQYRDLLIQLQAVEKRLSEVTKEMNASSVASDNIFKRLSSTLNKYFLMVTTVVSGLVTLIATSRKAVQAFMEVDEAMTKIRKYAGLTKEEAQELSDSLADLSRLDTRTSHLALLELAADAGRLGIKGKKDLEAFVAAADKINISLGEDLGKDAVANIGKLANLFGEDKRLGLETAMLSTASAVTKLAKSSTATEPYLVNFASRMGGIGVQADMTTGDILGLGSALDQNMQKVEMSSTAISTLITKMFQDTARFARLVGFDVQQFTDLLKTDANEALLQFLQAMQSKGGFDVLAPMFAEMQMSGKRAIQVLSTLASHVDQVREAQVLANAAYDANLEVQSEFDKMNNTAMAQLEKRKKEVQAIRVELGERLMPALMHVKTAQSLLLRTIKESMDFFSEHRSLIVSLTASIVALTVAANAHVVAQRLVDFWNNKLVVSFNKLRAALAKNPYAVIAAAVVALGGALADATRKAKQFYDQYQATIGRTRQAAAASSAQEKHIKSLLAVLNEEDASYERKAAAVGELISMNPTFLGCIDARTTSYNEAAKAVDRYLRYLRLQNEIEALEASNEELKEEESGLWDYARDKHPLGYRVNKFWANAELTMGKYVDTKFHGTNADGSQWESTYNDATYEQKARIRSHVLWEELTADDKQLKEMYDTIRNTISSNNQKIDELTEEMNNILLEASAQNQRTMQPFGTPTDTDKLKEMYEGPDGFIDTLNSYYDRIQHDLDMALARREISQEEYGVRSGKNETARQAALVNIYKQYYAATDMVAFESEAERDRLKSAVNKKRIKAEQDYEKAVISMEKSFYDSLAALSKVDDKAETDAYEKIRSEYEARQKTAYDAYRAIGVYIMSNVADTYTACTMMTMAEKAYYSTLEGLSRWYNYKVSEEDLRHRREQIQLMKKYGLDTVEAEHQIALDELRMYYDACLLTAEQYEQALSNLEIEYIYNRMAEREQVLSRFLTQSFHSRYQMELQQLELYHQKAMISEEEYQRSLIALKYKYARQYFDEYSEMTMNMVESLQQAEIDAVDSKYEILIRAAENNGEDTSELEMQQANEKLSIQKKYAMSNLVVKLSQITADTAVAIMTGFAQLGPVAGAIAAVLLAATGAAQYASAFAEYNKISRISLQSTPSSTQSDSSRMERVVQHYSGRYDVIGADDGRTYRSVPYIGPAVTGLVTSPALVAERGTELIVSADTLERLRTHINYPLVVDAINDARSGRVRQHASGSYESLETAVVQPAAPTSLGSDAKTLSVLVSIQRALMALPTNIRAYVVYDDVEDARKLQDRASSPFIRGDKN